MLWSQVGLVAFSNDADTPGGQVTTSTCYRTDLAKATAENKDYLRTYISGIQAGGLTFYIKALDKAFDYFDRVAQLDLDNGVSEDRGKTTCAYLSHCKYANAAII